MRALVYALAAPLFLGGTAALAQAPIWLVTCSNQANGSVLICEAAQSIVLAESNQRVASLRLVKEAGSPEAVAAITLPLGLYLPAGVSMSAGETTLGEAQIEACDSDGCYAALPLSAGWTAQVLGNDALTLGATTQDREAISFSFALDGLETSWRLMP